MNHLKNASSPLLYKSYSNIVSNAIRAAALTAMTLVTPPAFAEDDSHHVNTSYSSLKMPSSDTLTTLHHSSLDNNITDTSPTLSFTPTQAMIKDSHDMLSFLKDTYNVKDVQTQEELHTVYAAYGDYSNMLPAVKEEVRQYILGSYIAMLGNGYTIKWDAEMTKLREIVMSLSGNTVNVTTGKSFWWKLEFNETYVIGWALDDSGRGLTLEVIEKIIPVTEEASTEEESHMDAFISVFSSFSEEVKEEKRFDIAPVNIDNIAILEAIIGNTLQSDVETFAQIWKLTDAKFAAESDGRGKQLTINRLRAELASEQKEHQWTKDAAELAREEAAWKHTEALDVQTAQHKTAVGNLNGKIDDLNDQITWLNKDLDDLEAKRLADIEKATTDQQNSLDKAHGVAVRNLTANYERSIALLKASKARLESQVTLLKEELKTANNTISQQNETIINLEAENRNLAPLVSKEEWGETYKSQLADAIAESDAFEETAEKVPWLQKQVEELEKQKENLETQVEDLEKIAWEVPWLEKQIAELKTNNEFLQWQVNDSNTQPSELDALRARIEELEAANESYVTANTDLVAENNLLKKPKEVDLSSMIRNLWQKKKK